MQPQCHWCGAFDTDENKLIPFHIGALEMYYCANSELCYFSHGREIKRFDREKKYDAEGKE